MKLTDSILERGAADPRWFIETAFTIVNKDSKRVPFLFNKVQSDYWDKITPRDLVLKARKMGFSTIRLARMLAKCATMPNRNCVVVSHAEDATERLLGRLHDLIDNSLVKIVTDRKAASFISFPATKSKIWIGTAGSKAFGRGDDITDYELTEYAFWANPGLITGIEEACVNDAEGCIETTANGWGTPYHKMWDKASKREKQIIAATVGPQLYAPHFYGWNWDEGYSLPCARPLEDLEEVEREIKETYKLTDGQLLWRRAKIASMTKPEMYEQEYPLCPEQAFLVSGHMVFKPAAIAKQEASARERLWVGEIRDRGGKAAMEPTPTGRLSIWLPPKEGKAYIVSADVASGLGDDGTEATEEADEHKECFSVADVIDMESWEQVAQWHGRVPPDEFGDIMTMLGAFYNWGILAPEVNNHGLTTCVRIRDNNYPKLHIRPDTKGGSDMGFFTSQGEGGTRAQIINSVRAAVRDFSAKINSPATFTDLRTFVRLKNGKLGPQEGCFSDCVFSLGIGLVILEERGAIPERAQRAGRSNLSVSRRGSGSSVTAPRKGGYG